MDCGSDAGTQLQPMGLAMNSIALVSRALRPMLAATAATISLAFVNPAAAAPDWVDMGPIAGNAQGHVWSRVVDEVGNTKARAESWTLSQGVPSQIVITLRAPNPQLLDLRIKLRHPNGDTGEFRLPAPDKVIPGGYRQTIRRALPGSRPQGSDMAVSAITIAPASESMDQRYQLVVEVVPITGKSPATTTPAPTPVERTAAQMRGVWKRYGNGTLLESLEVGRDAQGWRVLQSEPGAKSNVFRIASLGDGWLELVRPFAPEYGSRIRLDASGRLVWQTYRKSDGGNWWTGSYERASP